MYKCLASDFTTLSKKVTAIEKKLRKHNLNCSFVEVSRQIEMVRVIKECATYSKELEPIALEVVSYEFTMDSLKVGDYTPIVVIDHTPEDGNLVYKLDESVELREEWFAVESKCDHCQHNRKRNKTVILQDVAGDLKQVGTTCIKDYTGIDAQDIIKLYAEVHTMFVKDDELWVSEDRMPHSDYVNTERYLAHCIDIIEKTGYKKESTKYEAFSEAQISKPSNKSIEVAKTVIEYFKSHEYSFSQDFLRNVQTSLKNEYSKSNGLVAYAYLAYQKEIEKEAKRVAESNNARQSGHVGTVGEKVEVEVTMVKSIAFETNYGTSRMYLMEDSEHNLYKWNSSTHALYNKEIGDKFKIAGTIKSHDEYNDTKQTTLTRCKEV